MHLNGTKYLFRNIDEMYMKELSKGKTTVAIVGGYAPAFAGGIALFILAFPPGLSK